MKDLAANSVTLADRPNVRVDNGFLESISIAGTNPQGGPQTGVKTATFYGLEGAGILGPVSVQGEYSHMHLNRYGAAPSLDFDGYYVFGSFFLTGESRSFKGGRDRPPAADPSVRSEQGQLGRVRDCRALRPDQFDRSRPVAARS